jgi:undecaprenyl-diphosphatase
MVWLEALVLGVVQGITEFLPVSSDGHLLLAETALGHLKGQSQTGAENLFLFVILHLGTTAAILFVYRGSIVQAIRGLLGAADVPPGYTRADIIHVGILAAIATSPLVPFALFFKKMVEATFQGTRVAGFGFLATAAVLLATVWLARREGTKGAAQTKWWHALLIGLAQTFAPLPGVSRSGVTIAAALALGLSPGWAVGFSLLIAVPAIMGATVFEIKDVDPSKLTFDRVGPALLGTVVAAVVGYFAIIWLTRVVRSGRISWFALYLIVLGVAVLSSSSLR